MDRNEKLIINIVHVEDLQFPDLLAVRLQETVFVIEMFAGMLDKLLLILLQSQIPQHFIDHDIELLIVEKLG